MRVLLVNYHHLDSNSGIHIFNLANHLTRIGVECTVCVPTNKKAVHALGSPLFEVAEMAELMNGPRRSYDLIHAWTPRELVRANTHQLQAAFGCPYLVHLEDNEEALTASATGVPFEKLARLGNDRLDVIIPGHLSHPVRYRDFIQGAVGYTVLMDTLLDFCPPERPCEVIWPGYDENIRWDMPPDLERRTRLKIADGERVVVYTGNVHAANHDEVVSLYLAVALLNRRGIKTRLVRTGTDYVPFMGPELWAIVSKYCIQLGHIARQDLPSILSIADVLVQPGRPGPFNDYRFPSKLPEWLASGKPVMLPATNLGRFLKDGENCLVLQRGDALEIAQRLEYFFAHSAALQELGVNGQLFARENFSWQNSAEKLSALYRRMVHPAGTGADAGIATQGAG